MELETLTAPRRSLVSRSGLPFSGHVPMVHPVFAA
jgi:hypothetical protein